MADIQIESIDESTVRLLTDRGILQEIAEHFTFYAPNHKFHPKVKAGIWDGKIRPISVMRGTAPKGLVPSIMKLAKELGYSVSLGKEFELFLREIPYIKDNLNLPFDLYDYQETAIKECLRKKRAIILSSTGSGKSFIIYNLVRTIPSEKTLILTPRVSLVTQMFNDFKEYSEDDDWSVDNKCHMIHSGADKNTDKEIIISTWQSLFRMPEEYFSQFDAVIVDEVHEFDAKSGTAILSNCTNAFFRFAFTGTLADAKTHEINLTGLIGPIKRVSSTADLMDRGVLSDLKINSIVLKYPEKDVAEFKKLGKENGKKHNTPTHQQEIDFVVQNTRRNKIIGTIAKKVNGNSLILVNFIEKHGVPLYKELQKIEGKEVHFIYGGTDADTREKIRQLMEEKSNIVVIASMKLFSTGINIKNLPHIIFAHPTKSKIRILQSIGRGLRLHDDKKFCTLWDIGDDLRGKNKSPNHTLKHFLHRYELYMKEKFKVNLVQKDL